MRSASSSTVMRTRSSAALALGDQVLEATGSGDEDVDASAERGGLRPLRDATEHRRATQANCFGERCDRAGDLRRELAGGDEHERTRAGGCPSIVGSQQRAREGHREGNRLAAAGASAAEDVTPSERVRQGRRLDRERSRDPGAGERELRSEPGRPTRRTTSVPAREVAVREVAVPQVGVRRVAAAAARDAIRGCGADGRHHGAWGTKVFLSRAVRPWMLRLHAHRAGNHGRTGRPHFRPRQPSWGWRPAHPTGSGPRTSAAAAGMGVETRVDSWPRTTGFGFVSWRS